MRCRKPRRGVCLLFSQLETGLTPGILADLGAHRLYKMVCARGLRKAGGTTAPVKFKGLSD
jgi:hypothetical protein